MHKAPFKSPIFWLKSEIVSQPNSWMQVNHTHFTPATAHICILKECTNNKFPSINFLLSLGCILMVYEHVTIQEIVVVVQSSHLRQLCGFTLQDRDHKQ